MGIERRRAAATVALAIAAIGIYGLLAYSVTRRTREIGLRLALGAAPSGVLRLVIGEGMKITIVGLTIGALGGFMLGRALRSLVYQVPVHDPATFAGGGGVAEHSGVGGLRGAGEARRASRSHEGSSE